MTSKPVRPGPSRSWASASSAVAAASVGRLAIAVTIAAGPRMQLQRRRGDDAERAFAADEEVAQVVAGVVLAQARQAVPDLALGRHHLEAEAELARIAVAQHLRAAGVGGEVAADRAAAFGGEAEREQQAVLRRRLLHPLQHAAGLGDEGEVGCVDAADAVQAGRREHDLAAARIGHRAADQAGVAALRDDARAVRAAQAPTTAATSSVEPGRTTASARPRKRLRQSTSYADRGRLRPARAPCRPPRADRRAGSRWRRRVARPRSASARRRARTCTAQATKSASDSATSSVASSAPGPRSLVARTAPSAT